MRKLLGCWLLLLMLVLTGCGRDTEATPTPTKTPAGAADSGAQAAPTPTPPPAAEQPANTAIQQPTAAAQPPPAEGSSTVEVAVINADLLNIRGGPSTTDAIVRTANQGERFTVASRSPDGAWVQIAQNEQPVGWVSSEFVTISTETASGGDAPAASNPTPAPATNPPAASGPALTGSMLSPDFGGQAFLWWKQEIADRDLKLMEDAAFNWVKQTFAWETIETTGKGQFDWGRADRVVQHVRDHNLKLLARLSTDPELTTFWGGKPPQNINNFAEFAFALASRYNCTPQAVGCIQAYQIWNEPNLGREWGNNRPNPAQYVEMLRATYAAIKRANPNAIVISAGMAPTGDNSNVAMPDDVFYEEMYKAMGGNGSNGYFDMLGVHGAGFAAPPEIDPAEAAANPKYGGYRFFAFRHGALRRYQQAGRTVRVRLDL